MSVSSGLTGRKTEWLAARCVCQSPLIRSVSTVSGRGWDRASHLPVDRAGGFHGSTAVVPYEATRSALIEGVLEGIE